MNDKGAIARIKALPALAAARLRLLTRSERLPKAGRTLRARGRAIAESGLARQLRLRAAVAVNRVGLAMGSQIDGTINRELVQELEAEVERLRRRLEVLTDERDAERAARAAAEARLAELQDEPERARSTPRGRSGSRPKGETASGPGKQPKGRAASGPAQRSEDSA